MSVYNTTAGLVFDSVFCFVITCFTIHQTWCAVIQSSRLSAHNHHY